MSSSEAKTFVTSRDHNVEEINVDVLRTGSTITAQGNGLTAMTNEAGAGIYTFTIRPRLREIVGFVAAGQGGDIHATLTSYESGSGVLTVTTFDGTAAADLANGEGFFMTIKGRRSSAPYGRDSVTASA